MTATAQKPGSKTPLVDKIRVEHESHPFIVEADRCGELPLLEHRGPDFVDSGLQGDRDRKQFPWLSFDRRSGAMVIDRSKPFHTCVNGLQVKTAELVELIEKQFEDHENGTFDWPAVRRYNLRRGKRARVVQPFGNYDRMSTSALIDMVANQMEGDRVKDEALIQHVTKYELQRAERKDPLTGEFLAERPEVIHALEQLLVGVTDEDASGETEGL